jgi:prepilin-type N-terminal cleavage/methylation domain-containing protein
MKTGTLGLRACRLGRKPGNGTQAGFSLIEIVVAMALLALTVALIPGSLRLGFRAMSSHGELDRTANLDLALDQMGRRIMAAVPLFQRDARGGVRVLFRGDATSLFLLAPGESGPSGAGVYRTWLVPVEAGDGEARGLALALAPHEPGRPLEQAPGTGQRHPMATTGIAVRFRYFGAQPLRAQPDWHETWQRNDALPRLVEINARSLDPAQPYARRIVVRPRIEVLP